MPASPEVLIVGAGPSGLVKPWVGQRGPLGIIDSILDLAITTPPTRSYALKDYKTLSEFVSSTYRDPTSCNPYPHRRPGNESKILSTSDGNLLLSSAISPPTVSSTHTPRNASQ
ncbi:hypothetical protein DXG03_009370 [Asterophora parasitica]|uniref:Uncharacterized protein n=1 Tax=Asterophora parasitica TaxID=117018 RepID=A0A9P7GHJ8_9AGAR|nr:hypothetical protein DXG03_009370 [Asterophora parasitica]